MGHLVKKYYVFFSLILLGLTTSGKTYSIVYAVGTANYELNEFLPSNGFLTISPNSYMLIMDDAHTSYLELFNGSSNEEVRYKLDSLLTRMREMKGDPKRLDYGLSQLRGFTSVESEYTHITHNPNLYRCPMAIYTIAPQKCTLYNDMIFLQWTHVKKNNSTYQIRVTNLFEDLIFSANCRGNFLSFTWKDRQENIYILRSRRLKHPNEECQDDILLVRLDEAKRKQVQEQLERHKCLGGAPFATLLEIQIYQDAQLFMDANYAWQNLTSYSYLPGLFNSYKKFLVEQGVAIVNRTKEKDISDLELFFYYENSNE